LNILGSIDLPTKGDVTICGNIIKASNEDKILAGLRLSYLGFVF
jgi:putative ABC transport system ATP-binding protein